MSKRLLLYADGSISDDFTYALKMDGTRFDKDEGTVIFDSSKGKNFIWSKVKKRYVLLSAVQQ